MSDSSYSKTQSRLDFELECLLFLASAMQATERQRIRMAADKPAPCKVIPIEAATDLAHGLVETGLETPA